MCRTHIGTLDPATQAYKLHKPQISLLIDSDSQFSHLDPEKWLTCTLLTASESQGVRRLLVYSSANADPAVLHIWLFAPDLVISSSAAPSPEPLRVAKIMYRDGTAEELEAVGKLGGSEGELELSTDDWKDLRTKLDDSASLLPESAKMMGEWRVGLLKRFTAGDLVVQKWELDGDEVDEWQESGATARFERRDEPMKGITVYERDDQEWQDTDYT
jgi:ubiquitin-protein ligase E3 D